jgi:NAD(P)-dependent dehydrogenase (short-subunit alcohol dehydrogenase family)
MSEKRLEGKRVLVTQAAEMDDDTWHQMFDIMVHPLHRLCRAVLPKMYERRAGKVVVIGSATGLKSLEGVSAYGAARSAQVGYVRAAGSEAARFNVQINLIAQTWVENPAYFPPEFTATDQFKQLLDQHVPLGRLATPLEDALFALFLASGESDFFVGQAIPFSGGLGAVRAASGYFQGIRGRFERIEHSRTVGGSRARNARGNLASLCRKTYSVK